MQRSSHVGGLLCLMFCLHPLCALGQISLSDGQAEQLGKRIWVNETGGNDDRLLWWNEGEEFASLGIGHFIWFPANSAAPFEQSFPELLLFLADRRVPLPVWLHTELPPPCPWPNRAAFLAAANERRMLELRELLKTTFALQARFMAQRAERALPRMLSALPDSEQMVIRKRFSKVASSPGGLYAIVDYVNFKGYGTAPSERYEGEGWGLLQVLQTMGDHPEHRAVDAFADAAETVLRRRVRNAPPARNESRWIPGWLKRVATYRAPIAPISSSF